MSDLQGPADEAALSETIKTAHAAGQPVEIAGGGSRKALGRPVQAERTLSTSALNGIELYEPGALCLVAKAGTPLRTIEETLGAENQRLAFEPMDHRALLGTADAEPTIGGIVACGVSGPRRIQAGACRDSLIGVRFVNGRGDIVKNGGRVMKNVTGYDLVKLMCGTYGTLGILTEVSFKLLPQPETEASIVVEGLDDVSAVKAMSAALGSPFDITGAAHIPAGFEGSVAKTLIRIEGFETSVSYRSGKLTELLAPTGASHMLAAADSRAAWRDIRDCRHFADGDSAVWRVSVKPSDGPEFVAALGRTEDVRAYYDWGGGLIWISVADKDDAAAALLRTHTARLGGHATLVRASPQTRMQVAVFEPEPPVVAQLTNGIRQSFDPGGILNPGRMGH